MKFRPPIKIIARFCPKIKGVEVGAATWYNRNRQDPEKIPRAEGIQSEEDRAMRKKKLFFAVLLVAIVAALTCSLPVASANSALMYWNGVNSSGASVVGEDCPVEVLSETLVFDVPEFPQTYYDGDYDFNDYKAKVTATYKLKNPADYAVDLRLAFPFGTVPTYAADSAIVDGSLYAVTENGNKVGSKVRYTLSGGDRWAGSFVTADAVARLKDEKTSFGVFGKDAKVVKTEYTVGSETAGFVLRMRFEKIDGARVFPKNYSGYESGTGYEIYSMWVNSGDRVEICCIGIGDEPAVTFSATKDFNSDKSVDLEIAQTDRTEQTLDAFAQSVNPFSEGSETDWFNIVAEALSLDRYSPYDDVGRFVGDYVLCWYEYCLHFEAGEEKENSVSAPLFPSLDLTYVPTVYTYDYLLSPAKGWADFGTLEIRINTPYFVLDAEKKGFEKTEEGYVATFDSLPDGELRFSMSASENPEKSFNWSNLFGLMIVLSVLVPIFGVAEVVAVVVTAIVCAFKKNKSLASESGKRRNTLLYAGAGFVSATASAATAALGPFVFFVVRSFASAIFSVLISVLSVVVTVAAVFVLKGMDKNESKKDESADNGRAEDEKAVDE